MENYAASFFLQHLKSPLSQTPSPRLCFLYHNLIKSILQMGLFFEQCILGDGLAYPVYQLSQPFWKGGSWGVFHDQKTHSISIYSPQQQSQPSRKPFPRFDGLVLDRLWWRITWSIVFYWGCSTWSNHGRISVFSPISVYLTGILWCRFLYRPTKETREWTWLAILSFNLQVC